MGLAKCEIKTLKATELSKDKAVMEVKMVSKNVLIYGLVQVLFHVGFTLTLVCHVLQLSNEVKKMDEKLRTTEKQLENKVPILSNTFLLA